MEVERAAIACSKKIETMSDEEEVKNDVVGRSESELRECGGTESSRLEMKRYLQERIEKKEEQILKIEASVFQVANYYFVFQGVIFAAVVKGAGSSSLKCHHFWLPLSLSAIGAALNFGTLLTVAGKYKEALNELDDRRKALYKHHYPKSKHQKKNKAWRQRALVLSMFLFCIFVFLNLAAAWIIPCT